MNESGNNEVRKEQSLNSNNQDPLKSIVLSQIGTDSQSSTIYVSTDGNDSNSGSFIAPFRTIQHAINNAQAGDVISIRGGTYRERLKIKELNGHKDAPITFVNYQNEEVILTGAEAINAPWVKHDDNIWKTNLNFDISQLYLCLLYTSPSPRD